MKKYLLLLVFPLFIFACAPRTGAVLYEEPEDVIVGVADSLYNLELFYVATTPEFLVFESTFINHSDEEMLLQREDFEIRIPEFAYKANPYSTDDLMEFLMIERKQIKKAKRRQTIFNGISLGASLLGAGFGGLNTFDAIYYPLTDLLNLTGDRQFSNGQIRSVEEEMDYIGALNIDSTIVGPRDTVFKEIFFPFNQYRIDTLQIIYQNDEEEHIMVLDSKDLR